jgi:hypothetical protein
MEEEWRFRKMEEGEFDFQSREDRGGGQRMPNEAGGLDSIVFERTQHDLRWTMGRAHERRRAFDLENT